MEDRKRHGELRVLEVGVEARELAGRAERLVGHRPERERCDVDAGDALGPPAGAVRASLGVLVLGWSEHELFDAWKRGESRDAERLRPDRDAAPAARLETFRPAGVLDRRAQPALAEEAHREPGAGPSGQRLGEWQQDPRAVTRDAVGRPRPAVPDGGKPGEGPIEQLARRAPAHVRDEADATGIPFASWVVQKALLVGHGPSPFAWW